MNLEMFAKEHENSLLENWRETMVKGSLDYIQKLNIPNLGLDDEIVYELLEWVEDDRLEEMLFNMLAGVYLKRSMTAQALTGMMFNRLRKFTHQQEIVNMMLNAVVASGLVDYKRRGMYLYFDSKYKVTQDIQDKLKKMNYVLPSTELPLKIENNSSIGYRTITESLICGGRLKHHDYPLNYGHINRMNRTPYRVETRVGFMVKPVFDSTPKLKDNGEWESEEDISKRFQQFNRIVDELPGQIQLLTKQGNRFYIHHRYDNGGRTYAKAYHFNYQSIGYCKAMIQSYEREIVEPEF